MSAMGATIALYLLIGIAIGEIAILGSRLRGSKVLGWKIWAAGIIFWPIMLYIGREK